MLRRKILHSGAAEPRRRHSGLRRPYHCCRTTGSNFHHHSSYRSTQHRRPCSFYLLVARAAQLPPSATNENISIGFYVSKWLDWIGFSSVLTLGQETRWAYYTRLITEVYKMFHGLSTIDISNFFELDTYGRTRGHLLKLKKGRVSTDLRRHFFTERVVKIWNSLADGVVQSQSLNGFKSSLQREYNKDKSSFGRLLSDWLQRLILNWWGLNPVSYLVQCSWAHSGLQHEWIEQNTWTMPVGRRQSRSWRRANCGSCIASLTSSIICSTLGWLEPVLTLSWLRVRSLLWHTASRLLHE